MCNLLVNDKQQPQVWLQQQIDAANGTANSWVWHATFRGTRAASMAVTVAMTIAAVVAATIAEAAATGVWPVPGHINMDVGATNTPIQL